MDYIEKLKEHVLDRLRDARASNSLPKEIFIATYSDDAALRRFRPGKDWPGGAAEHTAAMLKVAAAVSKDYPELKINLKDIEEKKYDAWLVRNMLEDNEESRAMFIASETKPKRKRGWAGNRKGKPKGCLQKKPKKPKGRRIMFRLDADDFLMFLQVFGNKDFSKQCREVIMDYVRGRLGKK